MVESEGNAPKKERQMNSNGGDLDTTGEDRVPREELREEAEARKSEMEKHLRRVGRPAGEVDE